MPQHVEQEFEGSQGDGAGLVRFLVMGFEGVDAFQAQLPARTALPVKGNLSQLAGIGRFRNRIESPSGVAGDVEGSLDDGVSHGVSLGSCEGGLWYGMLSQHTQMPWTVNPSTAVGCRNGRSCFPAGPSQCGKQQETGVFRRISQSLLQKWRIARQSHLIAARPPQQRRVR